MTAGAEGFQRRARAGRRGAGARREKEVRDTKARLQHEVRARLAAEAQAQVGNVLKLRVRRVKAKTTAGDMSLKLIIYSSSTQNK